MKWSRRGGWTGAASCAADRRATTSKRHTAVKIAPAYRNETIHVVDASRAVPVVSALIHAEARKALGDKNRAEQRELREQFENRAGTLLLTHEEAARRKLHTEWDDRDICVPEFTGRRVLTDFPLAELVPLSTGRRSFTPGRCAGAIPIC
jgi:5-methyltetrahydrofolate--homocysteine methyltransferase